MSIESLMPPNNLIFCCPLLLLSSIFPSIRVLTNDSFVHIRWPKYWRFVFNISSSNEHSGLFFFFKIHWFDLLVFQGTLKSLHQHYSSKVSFLWHSAFFMEQLSHPYMTIGKTIVLTIQTFNCKEMSLLLRRIGQDWVIFTFTRFIIAFLPRNKHLLISLLQSPSAVILEPNQENKVCHGFHFLLIYLPSSDGTRCHDHSFLNVEF